MREPIEIESPAAVAIIVAIIVFYSVLVVIAARRPRTPIPDAFVRAFDGS